MITRWANLVNRSNYLTGTVNEHIRLFYPIPYSSIGPLVPLDLMYTQSVRSEASALTSEPDTSFHL